MTERNNHFVVVAEPGVAQRVGRWDFLKLPRSHLLFPGWKAWTAALKGPVHRGINVRPVCVAWALPEVFACVCKVSARTLQ